MKKTYSVFVALLFVLVVIQGARAIEVPAINMALMSQDPDPVSPGRYVDVRFKIYNERSRTVADSLVVEFVPQYPFSLDPGENPQTLIGDLPATSDGKNVVIVKYRVKVDNRAVEGETGLKLKYKTGLSDWVTKEFPVNVQTVDANIGISSVTTEPENIRPGEKAEIRIKVKNMADSPVRDVSMKLDLTFTTLTEERAAITAADQIVAFNALPFAPLGSATEQKIDMLLPGEEKTFSYDLIAYSDAESKVYKIPIQLVYYDDLQNKYTKNDLIGIIVGTKPDLSVVIDDTDLYVGKNSGTVSIKFINKGFTDVKFLDVVLEETDCFKVISANEVYVGNVDSDDYETAEFRIYCTKSLNTERTIDLPVKIQYRDSNNNLYTETYTLPMNIYSAKTLGQGNGSISPLVILLIIAAAAVVFFIRKRKKKSK